MSPWSIDRDLLIRGAFILLLDLVLMSRLAGVTILQVLYAIGASMMLMVPLRRLGTPALFWLSLALVFGGEAITALLWDPANAGSEGLLVNLTFAPRFGEGLFIPYPAIPWLAIMMLGWAFGERYVANAGSAQDREAGRWAPERVLLVSGVVAIGIFIVVRGLDGYGNMFLHREDGSLVQWLHVSKYPPSLAFTSLELGLMALVLCALMHLEKKVKVREWNPILVFGQTALFFYILHFLMLGGSQGLAEKGGLGLAYLAAGIVLVVLYPVCFGYRALKRRYPTSVLRFV